MIQKRLLKAHRRRRIPKCFNWVDPRLIRQGWLKSCSVEAWALYLFLILASDAYGLSYYSERKISGLLGIAETAFKAARFELLKADLIAWEYPLYQVLNLDRVTQARGQTGEASSVGDILKSLMEGGAS